MALRTSAPPARRADLHAPDSVVDAQRRRPAAAAHCGDGGAGRLVAAATGWNVGTPIDGDGRDEVLFGGDGLLQALRVDDGSLVWSLRLPVGIGDLLLTDMDGRGLPEVVVATGDSHLYVVEQVTAIASTGPAPGPT